MSSTPARPTAQDARFAVDDAGLRVPVEHAGPWRVAFDGRVVLSLTTAPEGDDDVAEAAWVGVTSTFLDGVSHVTLHRGEEEVDLGEVAFGSGEGRVDFSDGEGHPVVIDKWGLAQQPFDTRGADVPRFLAERALELCAIARDECGIELWIAFGTLLGAARSGSVIPHDSDIDLAFLADDDTPYRLHAQLYALRRALSRAGLWVVNKTGSFLTVRYDAPDGSDVSIDVYTCFHLHDLLYETASARAPLPRKAVLPLTTMTFEGLELPAPADPSALLEVSYGPGWRHPDPSFEHKPSYAVRSRFDGWFGNAMRRRRDWEVHWESAGRSGSASDFSRWVRQRVAEGTLVVELGIGRGDDAVAYARAGLPVAGLDYARQAGRAVIRVRGQIPRSMLAWSVVNLYDLRDCLAWGAEVARRGEERRVVVARGTLEALRPEERDGFWALVRMLGRRSAGLLLELDESTDAGEEGRDGTWRFPATRAEVREAVARAGGRVVEEVLVGTDECQVRGGVRWRMVADWPQPSSPRQEKR